MLLIVQLLSSPLQTKKQYVILNTRYEFYCTLCIYTMNYKRTTLILILCVLHSITKSLALALLNAAFKMHTLWYY